MKMKLSQTKLTFFVSLFLATFYNYTFFKKVLEVYPLSAGNILFITSLFVVLCCAINLFLSLLRIKPILKGFLYGVFFLSMLAAYVMDSFGIAIDEVMLLNVIKTDVKESLDLFTVRFCFYAVILFLLPTFAVYKVDLEELSKKTEFGSRLKSIALSLVIAVGSVAVFGKFYASFFREQKPLRYYTNPTYYMYSMGKFASGMIKNPKKKLESLGKDSLIPVADIDRELIIIVVGETARRDRFSLNGYSKETNPLLKNENVYSFTNVTSCGTSTAVSVPCMFSNLGRVNFNVDEGKATENLLDVLLHTNDVNILWRDNNSDSKDVATRVKYEDYKTPTVNTVCDVECRDVGMLVGLQKHVDQAREKDIVIVLHQMGNHGPAYYKRYPLEFEKFKPACKTNELSQCSNEEISNAYDNAILYTDFFLSKVIEFLKANEGQFNTAMLYISDHGESLGENGVYLHSMPYMIAPKAQIEIPMILWLGGEFESEINHLALSKALAKPFSHDNVFHTILNMMEIESSVYDPKKDILHGILMHPTLK